MDNLTHSLTGALAAKIVETNTQSSDGDRAKAHRTLFWLTVICANLPDIDALFNLMGDPFFVIKHHRGITHSLLFAPVLSFFPAMLAYLFSSVKNLKLLWVTALLGVYLHIFFDLITQFGTQLFAPFSGERYSLDWMFIIDPLFTGILMLTLFLGKTLKQYAKGFILAGGLFVVSYLLVEMVSHQVAYQRIKQTAQTLGIAAEKVSAFPQPLSIFRWMGLVQTNDGLYQTFFSVFDNPEPPVLTKSSQANGPFVERALRTDEASWFMKFARHPLIQSAEHESTTTVVIRDQQFSFDPEFADAIGNALGVAEREPPFVLRFQFTHDGTLLTTTFNR